jgi:hypothetical protein
LRALRIWGEDNTVLPLEFDPKSQQLYGEDLENSSGTAVTLEKGAHDKDSEQKLAKMVCAPPLYA